MQRGRRQVDKLRADMHGEPSNIEFGKRGSLRINVRNIFNADTEFVALLACADFRVSLRVNIRVYSKNNRCPAIARPCNFPNCVEFSRGFHIELVNTNLKRALCRRAFFQRRKRQVLSEAARARSSSPTETMSIPPPKSERSLRTEILLFAFTANQIEVPTGRSFSAKRL